MLFFKRLIFSVFFDFGAILGGLGSPGASQKSPKIVKTLKKSVLGSVWGTSFFEGGFWEGFGRILGWFGEDFGRILGGFERILKGFWVEFGKVLEGCWEDKF